MSTQPFEKRSHFSPVTNISRQTEIPANAGRDFLDMSCGFSTERGTGLELSTCYSGSTLAYTYVFAPEYADCTRSAYLPAGGIARDFRERIP